MAGLLAKDIIEPMLKKPLPAWTEAAEPLWLLPVVIVAVAAAWTKVTGPRAEVRLIAALAASLIVMLHMAASPAFTLAYDLEPAAGRIKAWHDEGRPVLYVGKYHGEFQFLGRLEQPVENVNKLEDAVAWAAVHPTGVIIATKRESEIPPTTTPFSVQPYRGKVLVMWDAKGFKLPPKL